MLNIAMVCGLALSAPFTDVQGRFTLDLPEGWQFTPLPGDTAGAAFARKAADMFASAAVRMVPVDPASSPQVWATALVKAVEKTPGFKLTMKDDAKLGGANAARRRYMVFVDGDPKRPKVAEDRVVVQDGVAIFVHVETLDDSFALFEPDFAQIFGTLALGKGGPAAIGNAGPLVGKWLMKDTPDTFLDLKPDGTFDLAGTSGTYQVQGDLLITRQATGAVENFNFRLEGDELALASPNFDEPMRYVRVGAAPGAAGIVGPMLVGRWVGPGHKLELKANGQAVLDKQTGVYHVKGAILTLTFGSKKVVLGFTILRADVLRISGERFGKGLDLKKK
jgi:hypothetical protein